MGKEKSRDYWYHDHQPTCGCPSKKVDWNYPVPDEKVMVLHTLVISLQMSEKGHCASILHRKLEYKEIGIVLCIFNGIKGVRFILLKKKLVEKNIQSCTEVEHYEF